MLFNSAQREATEVLRSLQANLGANIYPALISSSFTQFQTTVASSCGGEGTTAKGLVDLLLSFSYPTRIQVLLQANMIRNDVLFQELYLKIVTPGSPALLSYQVENIYFSHSTYDWKQINSIPRYYEAMMQTTWHNPVDRLKSCYENWEKEDSAIADIMVLNLIKNIVVSGMMLTASRVEKKICGRLTPQEFSAATYLNVQKNKEFWAVERDKLVKAHQADAARQAA